MADEVQRLIQLEKKRQTDTLQMIPSENYASAVVRRVMGSIFTNKYAEGYPGKRYYQGNIVVDELERLCQDRAKKLFGVEHANVQPLSGSPANLAILKAITNPGDIQLSQHLYTGGHLSMGWQVSITGEYRPAIHYHLDQSGEVDWAELKRLAKKHHPKLIWSGGTGYTRIFDWAKYAQVADSVGAYLVADISHIGGLVAGGAHPSPVPFVHVVMTTTHKTLRGPRGAIILVTAKGLAKDPDLADKIDKAVFPGVQGGPHMENVAALAVALQEASQPKFKKYAVQIVKNSAVIAQELMDRDYHLVGGGSANHMIWIDLSNKHIDGWTAAWGLEYAGIIANRQTVPGDTRSPYYPSGLRLGTPAITTRGMREKEMKIIAGWIDLAIKRVQLAVKTEYINIGSEQKNLDQADRKRFKQAMAEDKVLLTIARQVKSLCRRFPTP
ncbi:MAG: serine hydroxymethyltransferase [bacterium]|nr:serine hydroxymethyltransferase [bacterium]